MLKHSKHLMLKNKIINSYINLQTKVSCSGLLHFGAVHIRAFEPYVQMLLCELQTIV